MFRKLTLHLILSICALVVGKYSYAITYVDNGTSNSYTLNAGDSLFVASGLYTGNIGGFALGAKITISDLATFQPTGMNWSNVHGTMYNYGTFIMNNAQFRTNSNFTMYNYGLVQINNETRMDGSNQLWVNNYGATINFVGDVLMNGDAGSDNNVLINYQTITSGGNFQMNSGSHFTNYKNFTETGNLRVNGGTLINEGNLDITGNILMNNGASVIRNYCRMQATAGINNTSGNFYNYSYVWAKNSDIVNSANIINSSVATGSVAARTTPMIHGRNYTHSGVGTMTGPALLYFYGTTTMTGGTMGVDVATADTIKMYDITRTTPPNIFDVQSGGIRHPNVIYNAWGIPDSTRNYLLGCSIEVILETPLPIKWNYFRVNLSNNNIPALSWSAEYDRGTTFEIQRSYNGSSFHAIKDVQSEIGRSEYKYDDMLVNNQVPVVFYRIKAKQLNGEILYSPIRIVRFNSKKGVFINTVPNPFQNTFTINYNAVEKEMILVRIFNVSGQQKLAKSVLVSSGNNSINITEAANFANGLYVVQVTSGDNIISISKIIKQ